MFNSRGDAPGLCHVLQTIGLRFSRFHVASEVSRNNGWTSGWTQRRDRTQSRNDTMLDGGQRQQCKLAFAKFVKFVLIRVWAVSFFIQNSVLSIHRH
jgi:hypothetical protein